MPTPNRVVTIDADFAPVTGRIERIFAMSWDAAGNHVSTFESNPQMFLSWLAAQNLPVLVSREPIALLTELGDHYSDEAEGLLEYLDTNVVDTCMLADLTCSGLADFESSRHGLARCREEHAAYRNLLRVLRRVASN